GVLDGLARRLVGQKDVRAVLHAVERGELDAGFVYATDARIADVVVLFPFDASRHPPIEYRAAVLRGAAQPDLAHGFLAFLRSDAVRAVLAEAGFEVPR
ncbi:extracellular solute-binding protein, partial [bacterium]|nr:extracellular solute-binding protein [bacterium]